MGQLANIILPYSSIILHGFDPSYDTDFTYSSDTTTATRKNISTSVTVARSVVSNTTGGTTWKKYFEVFSDASYDDTNVIAGVATSSLSNTTGIGNSPFAWGINASAGKGQHNFSQTVDGFGPGNLGVTFMIAMDNTGKLWLGKNGSWLSNPSSTPTYTGLSGTFYAVAQATIANKALTFRLDSSTFLYSIPSGFTSWA